MSASRLALLLKTRARVALAEGLVLGPFLGELLGETALRRNGPAGVSLASGGNLFFSFLFSWRSEEAKSGTLSNFERSGKGAKASDV